MQDPKTWYAAVSVANVWPTKAPSFSAELRTQRGRPEVGQDSIEILRLHRRRGLMEVTWAKNTTRLGSFFNISVLAPLKKHGWEKPTKYRYIYILYKPVNSTGLNTWWLHDSPMTRSGNSENWFAQLEFMRKIWDMTSVNLSCWLSCFFHMFSS